MTADVTDAFDDLRTLGGYQTLLAKFVAQYGHEAIFTAVVESATISYLSVDEAEAALVKAQDALHAAGQQVSSAYARNPGRPWSPTHTITGDHCFVPKGTLLQVIGSDGHGNLKCIEAKDSVDDPWSFPPHMLTPVSPSTPGSESSV